MGGRGEASDSFIRSRRRDRSHCPRRHASGGDQAADQYSFYRPS
jgi:hypothetical protein